MPWLDVVVFHIIVQFEKQTNGPITVIIPLASVLYLYIATQFSEIDVLFDYRGHDLLTGQILF
jgi:hypothetical protein